MPRIIKLVVLLYFACALPAQAQRVFKPRLKRASLSASPHIAAYRPMYGAVHQSIAISPTLPPARVGVLPGRLYETVSTTQKRSWLEQQQRNLKAWLLKKDHAKSIALRQKIAALPALLPAHTFVTHTLDAYRLEHISKHEIPVLPALTRPGYLYRGLGLSAQGNRLHNIFTNGLRVCDVGQFSNCLLLSLANSAYDAAAISTTKYTNLTNQPKIALDYALRNARILENGIPVIVTVKGLERHATVVQVTHDIEAAQIENIFILL